MRSIGYGDAMCDMCFLVECLPQTYERATHTRKKAHTHIDKSINSINKYVEKKRRQKGNAQKKLN